MVCEPNRDDVAGCHQRTMPALDLDHGSALDAHRSEKTPGEREKPRVRGPSWDRPTACFEHPVPRRIAPGVLLRPRRGAQSRSRPNHSSVRHVGHDKVGQLRSRATGSSSQPSEAVCAVAPHRLVDALNQDVDARLSFFGGFESLFGFTSRGVDCSRAP